MRLVDEYIGVSETNQLALSIEIPRSAVAREMQDSVETKPTQRERDKTSSRMCLAIGE